jgi:UDP-N-acetylglucosamine 2-epimerase
LSVLVVGGTRPEAIKLAPVIHQLSALGGRCTPLVCSTAQHRQMLDSVWQHFGIQPQIDLDVMQAGQTLSDLTARILTVITPVLKDVRPAAVLVQGDTTTVLAASLAAFYLQIPVGHIEAGLRTYQKYSPFPEEINRQLVSRIASWHYAPTSTAVQALLAEGVPASQVVQTGNTVIDALHWTLAQPPSAATQALFAQYALGQYMALPLTDRRSRLVLVTAHRRESFGEPFIQLCSGLRRLAIENPALTLLYPVHLNPNVQQVVRQMLADQPNIHLLPPLPYETFCHVLQVADLVLTDSGGVQEEAPALGKPVLVLRNDTERPEGVAAGTAKLIGTNASAIVANATQLLQDPAAYQAMANAVSPYGDGRAAARIAAHLASVI